MPDWLSITIGVVLGVGSGLGFGYVLYRWQMSQGETQ